MASLLPSAKSYFPDQNGRPLSGGKVYFYRVGTEIKRDTFQDRQQSIPNSNPVILDGRGEAVIWGSGAYRQVLTDANDNLIWDQVVEDANASLTGNITNARWVAGTNYSDPVGDAPGTFVPNTTTTFNLPVAPGSITNLAPYFDAAFQQDDQIASLDGTTLTFNGPVPFGVQSVEIKIGSTIAIGAPADGSVTDAKIAAGSKVSNRIKMWFDVKDYAAIGDGVADDTSAVQAAINAANAVGGTCFFSPGKYLCGSLTVNAGKSGAICSIPNTASLIPKTNSTTFFAISNAQVFGKSFVITGLTFDNSTLKTGCVGVTIADYEQFVLGEITSIQMDYIVQATATSGGPNSYNCRVRNITQFGKGSFKFAASGTAYIFDTEISNVTQFSTGSDSWVAPWFQFVRGVNNVLSNIHSQSLSGAAIGLQCSGDCQGVFLSNTIFVVPSYGLMLDRANGDAVSPSYVYGANVAIDQPKISGATMLAEVCRFTNCNFTFGDMQSNAGVGVQILTGSKDIVFDGARITHMKSDGVQIQVGCSDIKFDNSYIRENATGGSGFDVDYVPNTARDPSFENCTLGTSSIISGSQVLNGGSLSRYVYCFRQQLNSGAGASDQAIVQSTLSPNSLVDQKTIRITASGQFAANANSKAVSITIGGVIVASQVGNSNGVAWKMIGECFRVDANSVWLVGDARAGSTGSVSSALQTPFNSAVALPITLLVSGVASGDVVVHHFDVELID